MKLTFFLVFVSRDHLQSGIKMAEFRVEHVAPQPSPEVFLPFSDDGLPFLTEHGEGSKKLCAKCGGEASIKTIKLRRSKRRRNIAKFSTVGAGHLQKRKITFLKKPIFVTLFSKPDSDSSDGNSLNTQSSEDSSDDVFGTESFKVAECLAMCCKFRSCVSCNCKFHPERKCKDLSPASLSCETFTNVACTSKSLERVKRVLF